MDNIPNKVERNKDGKAIGITARCACGWSSGGYFSGMSASAAKQDHQETCIVANKKE